MGIELPGWLRWVGDLIGEPFPEGDETACRRQADKWRHYADELSRLKADLDAATHTALSGFTAGEFHDKLNEGLKPYAASIDQVAGQMRALADAVEKAATEIEFAKEMFIANLVLLAASLTALLASMWINWGAPAEMAALVAASEAAISQVIRAAIAKVVQDAAAEVIARIVVRALEGAAINALMSGGLNAGIQGLQGIQGHRHEFDSKSFWSDVGSGAISGAAIGPIMKGAHEFDAGSTLGNHAKNFGASFVGNAGGALAAQQIMTGHMNLGDALGAGAVFGGIDGLRRTGTPGVAETTALTGDRTGQAGVSPLSLNEPPRAPVVEPGTSAPGHSHESSAGNVDIPLNLGSHSHEAVAPAGLAGADAGVTAHSATAPPANHPGVIDAPATGSPSAPAPPSTPQVASAPTGSPAAHSSSPPPSAPAAPARAGLPEAGSATASQPAGAPAARASDAVVTHGNSDSTHVSTGAESSTHPARDSGGLPPHDTPPARDVAPSRDSMPPRDAVPPHDLLPSREVVPPRDIVAPHEVQPARDAPVGRETPAARDAAPQRDAQSARDSQPRRDVAAPRDGQPTRDTSATRDGHSQPGHDEHRASTDRSAAADPTEKTHPKSTEDRFAEDSHPDPAARTEASTEHTKDTAGQHESEHARESTGAHDEPLTPAAIISAVLPPEAAHAARSMAAGTSHGSEPGRASGHDNPPKDSPKEPPSRRPDAEEPYGGDDPPPPGPGPMDPAGFTNHADQRVFGPHRLAPVEHPGHQAALENALHVPGRQGHEVWADPRNNRYGDLVNDGGPSVPGRATNCLDCALSALASFHGHPTVSAPRHLDRLPNGLIDESGEAGGTARAKAWLGDGLHRADPKLPIRDQFAALHEQIKKMGPGASALVVNEWHERDSNGVPMYDAHGRPVISGSHATVVVYPRDASGPVWWDPQDGSAYGHPPTQLTGRSASLWSTPLRPDHFGPPPAPQGGQHGATGHQGTSAGLPGAGSTGTHLSGVAVRDGLGLSGDPDSRGSGGGDGTGPREPGDRLGDRDRDGAPESGAGLDRGGLHGGETQWPHDRQPDLPLPVADHDSAHTGGSGDHHLPDGGGVPDRSSGTHPGASGDRQQTDVPERTAGHAVEHGGVARGMDEPPAQRGLAGGEHDGVLADRPAPTHPGETRPSSDVHRTVEPLPHKPDDHGAQEYSGREPSAHQDGTGPDDAHHHDADPGDRGRDVASHPDPQQAERIANEALWKRIPPVHPSEIRHHLADKAFGEQRARDNAAWWRELSGDEQRALIDSYPKEIGNADGIPPWARTEANDHRLSQLHDELQSRKDAGEHLSRPEKRELERYKEIRRALDEARGKAEKLGAEVHILAFDPHEFRGDGRMVVSVGHDPHHAEAVSWHVPGFSTTIDKIGTNLTNAMHHFESVRAEPGEARVASIAWIGYDAPQGLRGLWDVAHTKLARAGGDILRGDLIAFNAARDALAADGSHFSTNDVFGHSYGSTTTSFAGHGGELGTHARSITLAGSPGAGPVRHASEYGLGDRVFVASSSRDPITMLGARSLDGLGARPPETHGRAFGHGLGLDPAMHAFGAHRIAAEFARYMDQIRGPDRNTATHSAYYSFDSQHATIRTESLANFGRIGAGLFERVHSESHRFEVDSSAPGWWRTAEPAEVRALEHHADPAESGRRIWDPRWHSLPEHPGLDASCAHHVTDLLADHYGRDVVLRTEPGPTGVPARDLFAAWGSESHFASYAEVHDALLRHGDGSAAILTSRWAGGPEMGGHAYVAVNEGGTVHLYERFGDHFERSGWPPYWGEAAVDRTAVGYLDRNGNPVAPLDGHHRGLEAAEAVGDVAGHRSDPADPAGPGDHHPTGVMAIGDPVTYPPHAAQVAADLNQAFAGGNPTAELVRQVADLSTHRVGDVDRVVLGKYDGYDGGYIGAARHDGGIFYDTGSEAWQNIEHGLSRPDANELGWRVNEQFLRTQMENGVARIDYLVDYRHYSSVEDVRLLRPDSFSAKEIEFLQTQASKYGYEQVGDSWVLKESLGK